MIDIKASGKKFYERKNRNDPGDRIKRPSWLDQYNDSLAYLFYRFDELLENGKVVPASVVLANDKLYHRAGLFYRKDHPAYFVYSFDSYYDGHTDELETLAAKLLAVGQAESKNTKDEKKITSFFSGGKNRPIHKKVPESFTDGREVFFTTTIVSRKHLEKGKLQYKTYPLIVTDDEKADAMMLPKKYWVCK